MDAFVQIALMEKAKRIFAQDAGSMLCFPFLSPLTFSPAEIGRILSPSTAADYNAAADFARIVNFLPHDIVATATERKLWDVYREVLARAEVAESSDSSPDTGAAEALLYVAAADGSHSDSAALLTYRQYRDAWIAANEDYAAHRVTGELSEDPEVRRSWKETGEPLMRAQIDAAASAWETVGRRAAIERALQLLREAEASNPQSRWAQWSRDFNPDIDLLTDPSGGQYAPAGISPSDFAAGHDWLHFEMSAGEMAALVAGAPASLRDALPQGAGAGVGRVSFDYTSVMIVRPWFHPDVFTSQIWRSQDPDLILSNGVDPPSGACPAYATAIVFTRNLQTFGAGSPGHAAGALRFSADAWRFMPVAVENRTALVRKSAQPAPANAVSSPPPAAFSRLHRATFARVLATAPPQMDFQAAPRVPQAPPPPSQPPGDELSILAFICKRLPKAPNPLPTLHFATTSTGADVISKLVAAGIDFSVEEADIREWLSDSESTPYPAISAALLALLGGKRLRRPVYLDGITWKYEHAPGASSPRRVADVDGGRLETAVIASYNERYGDSVESFQALVQ
ncbi:hypothetical protein CCR94_04535 [Rhodoblastus sphagnicola]|uniref:Uncharacterized protein n=1 Tax=Rhodoblastus sphagnicola TaxID=333368 RepID=A0A2S6NDK3_9HYPH|nr:hypothetical protein [Rhodoblastus sphagnicola]MBB4200072.1 hypothetical protein [Rhodoblastus sphagnicola]PPQ32687.1 hypothetical protein CCR94_04535 [Rhodoblastus sphagnicola]